MANSLFNVPSEGTVSSDQDALTITNSGTGRALRCRSQRGASIEGRSTDFAGVSAVSDHNVGIVATSTGTNALQAAFRRPGEVTPFPPPEIPLHNGVYASTTVDGGSGVFGESLAPGPGAGPGVVAVSRNGDGMVGVAKTPVKSGVFGRNDSTAEANAPGGSGVFGLTLAARAAGVFGANNNPTSGRRVQGNGPEVGVGGFSAAGIGVRGDGHTGVVGSSTGASSHIGVQGIGSTGVSGESSEQGGIGVQGISSRSAGKAVFASAPFATGVKAEGFIAVHAVCTNPQVDGTVGTGSALIAEQAHDNNGIFKAGLAGEFVGDVDVRRHLIVHGDKQFAVIHPLDPAKELRHVCVESPERKTFYDGSVLLGPTGEAEVQLPDWFESLNGDFRYQLTCVGGFAPVYVAASVSGNKFHIAGGRPGLVVSWQISAVRIDEWARSHPFVVVQERSSLSQSHDSYDVANREDVTLQSVNGLLHLEHTSAAISLHYQEE